MEDACSPQGRSVTAGLFWSARKGVAWAKPKLEQSRGVSQGSSDHVASLEGRREPGSLCSTPSRVSTELRLERRAPGPLQ